MSEQTQQAVKMMKGWWEDGADTVDPGAADERHDEFMQMIKERKEKRKAALKWAEEVLGEQKRAREKEQEGSMRPTHADAIKTYLKDRKEYEQAQKQAQEEAEQAKKKKTQAMEDLREKERTQRQNDWKKEHAKHQIDAAVRQCVS